MYACNYGEANFACIWNCDKNNKESPLSSRSSEAWSSILQVNIIVISPFNFERKQPSCSRSPANNKRKWRVSS